MSDQQTIAVFGSSRTVPGSFEWMEAEMAGATIARAGLGVITGGYGGTMEAASRGAAQAGGRVIGVVAPDLFPDRSGANPYVSEVIEAESITSRIEILVATAGGVLALPGSIGTAAELLIAWNVNHIARGNGGGRIPTVAVGDSWARLTGILVEETGANPEDVHLSGSAVEGVTWLLTELENR